MDEFFKAVGFVPPNDRHDDTVEAEVEDAGSSRHSESTGQRPGTQDFWEALRNAGGGNSGGGKKGGGSGPNFGSKFADWSRKALIAFIIVLIIVILCAYWWFHPALSIYSADCWTFAFIFILLPIFVATRAMSAAYAKGTAKRTKSAGKAKGFKYASFIPVAVVVLLIVGAAASLSIWPGNAERYSSILDVQDSNFSEDIQEVDYNSIPVIDRDSAVLLGNRTLGEIPDFVSQFEISTLYSQINYQGRPVRVSPLNYADIFKWFTNKDTGIPAYVLVDMATQNTQVVRLDAPIYYSESEPLERNIDRYVQLKYPTYLFEQKSFEIDEEGTPWWVCPVQVRTIGLFGGEDISRVVLVNASTGECIDVSIEECPQWVDRAYPADLLIRQYNWFGSFSSGWINSFIGQSGVVQTTPGSDGNLGYNYIAKDDDVWVYTGVTSATADNAIVGFVLVNERTADAHFYRVAGATEESAMSSAEGQVQNLGYNATFPLLLNINGQPTYFMALKDNAGLVKKFAMLDIQRYQNVAIGDTVSDCQKSYKALLATNGVAAADGEDSVKEVTGVIRTEAQAVIDGNSHFYLRLLGDTRIYDCPLPGLIDIVAYAEGDTITLRYVDGEPTATVQEVVKTPEEEEAAVSAPATE